MSIDLSGYDPWSSTTGIAATPATSGGGSGTGSTLSTIASAAGSFFGGPLGGIAGSVLGGLFGGGDDDDAAKKAFKRQLQLQKNAQDFEESMSNSAINRRVKDLVSSGLNPMLAYMGTGSGSAASTPSGSSGASVPMASGIAKAQSAMQAATLGRESALTAAELMKTLSETKLVDAQTAETQARTPTYSKGMELTDAEIGKISYEIPKILVDSNLSRISIDKIGSEITNLAKTGRLTESQITETLTRADLNAAQIREVAPRIAKLLAETANVQAELPFVGAKSDVASGFRDLLHLPDASKFINSAAKGAGEGAAGIVDWFSPDSSRRTSKGYAK